VLSSRKLEGNSVATFDSLRALIGLSLAMVSGTLCAQTTRCQTVGNQTTCRQVPSSGIDWGLQQPQGNPVLDAMSSFEAGRRQADEARARDQAYLQQQQNYAQQNQDWEARRIQAEHESAAAALRQSVGIKIRSGECDSAVGEALQAGEIELAQAAKGLCVRR
jgi:hypothetical protein